MGNLNYRTTKEALVALLSGAGEVVDAFLPTDRETGRPRGFGFVTFASEEAARACVEQFNGQELDGRMLNINPADDRRKSGPPRGAPPRGRGGPPSRGRPSPIAEFKRGGQSDRPPPRRSAPPLPDPEEAAKPTYDADERKFHDGAGDDDDEPWKKKKKKRKGSRRGLRAKKRSL